MPQRPTYDPDPDVRRMAKPGFGVPSQDLSPEAQSPMNAQEQAREFKSSFSVGGLVAGIAVGATAGALLAGPAGVVLGCALGAAAGVYGGAALGQSLLPPSLKRHAADPRPD